MNNPLGSFSIEIYLGEKRSGKTLTMIAETFEQLKNFPNIKVFANMKLNTKYFPNYKYVTKKDLENFFENKHEFKNSVFLIDEIHIFMDSRKFARKGNQKIGYFVGQMGKRGNVFRGTTHFPHLIDFRLRSYCERWVYIKKGLLIKNNLWKPILNNNRILTEEENEKLYIKSEPVIRKLLDYEFYYVKDKTFYTKANTYFNMYDTEELIIDN